MKKIIILIIIIVLLTIGIIILFLIDFQKVKTNKKTYAMGETISLSFTDFKLYRCQCNRNIIEFYRQNNNHWELIPSTPEKSPFFCLNGSQASYLGGPIACFNCKFFDEPFIKKTVETEINFFEKIKDGPCETFPNEINKKLDKDKSFHSYVSKPAPAGLYKIKYGKAETIIEIK